MRRARALPALGLILMSGCTERPDAATLLAPSAPLQSAIASTESFNILITDRLIFVPCAAGGAGERVAVSGSIHFVVGMTIDDRGGFHGTIHSNPQGVSGVGETTGDVYRGTGMTRQTINGTVGTTTTFVDNFRIIGPGSGNNLLVHQTIHMTVHADGTVTAEVEHITIECK